MRFNSSAKLSALVIGAVFAMSGLTACKSSPKAAVQNPGSKIGVNAHLWQASLDTLYKIPLAQTDPFGGVIITDWYNNAKAPNERLKATVYILDARLRGDALKAAVFKQTRQGGAWVDTPTDADTSRKLESAILRRAAELQSGSGS